MMSVHAMVEDAEHRHIRSALERRGGSVMRTAESPGSSRTISWQEIKKLRIDKDAAQDAGRSWGRCRICGEWWHGRRRGRLVKTALMLPMVLALWSTATHAQTPVAAEASGVPKAVADCLAQLPPPRS